MARSGLTLGEVLRRREAEAKALAEAREAEAKAAKAAKAKALAEVKAARASKAPSASRSEARKPRRRVAPEAEAEPPSSVSGEETLPYEPPFFDARSAVAHPEAELASRELCRRHLLPFIQRFRPSYQPGWVHADICRRLEAFVRDIEAKRSPRMLLLLPYRHGKLIADETPVLTPGGWTTHGDLSVGDSVFSLDGRPAKILAVSAKGVADIEMTFSDGSVILCHERHEWRMFSRAHGGACRTFEAGYWLKHNVLSGKRCQYHLPRLEPLEWPDAALMTPRNRRGLVSVRRVSASEARLGQCIQVDRPDGMYLVGQGLIPTHNSEIASRHFPAWLLGHHPEWEVIATSNAQSLATSFSRYLRDLLRNEGYTSVFPDTVLDPRSQAAESWNLTLGGGYLAAGVGTSIIGRGSHCLSYATPLITPSGVVRIDTLQPGDEVLSYDFTRKRPTFAKVVAVRRLRAETLYSVGVDGQTVEATGDHRFYTTENGWVEACRLGVNTESRQAEQRPAQFGRTLLTLPFGYTQCVERPLAVAEEIGGGAGTPVIDIQVAGTQCFFANGVLVHNCLIIDDPVRDAEAADSQVIRDNVWEWYLSTAYSRLAPGGGVLGIMTCWNEDDWGGRVQLAARAGGDQYEVVRYPAINDQGDEYILEDGSIVQIPRTTPPQTAPAGARLTRRLGGALHPDRYTLEALLKIKANYYALGQKRWWSAGYQQNPVPDEGNFFTRDMFRYYSSPPPRSEMYVYQAWDFAISVSTTADYNVGITLGVDHRDNVHVLDVTRFQTSDGILIVETVVEYAQRWSVNALGVEDGQIWKSLRTQFDKVCQERRYWPNFEELKPLTDKMVRAGPLRGRMQAGRLWFDKSAPWYDALEREFLHFPAGRHDDIIDAASWCIRLTLAHSAPRERPVYRPPSWKDKLALLAGAKGGTWLAA